MLFLTKESVCFVFRVTDLAHVAYVLILFFKSSSASRYLPKNVMDLFSVFRGINSICSLSQI